MRMFRRGIAVSAAAIALVAAGQLQASATPQWDNDTWSITWANPLVFAGTSGGVVWGNRTVEVQGRVDRKDFITDAATVYIEGYAGATKIDSEVRSTGFFRDTLPFHFFIGDTNLPGGIDRIKLQLCLDNDQGQHVGGCTKPVNLQRD